MSEWVELPLAFWIAAPVVIVLAYTIFGISGFGSTVTAVPILANWVPLPTLVPLVVLLDMSSAMFVGRTSRRHVSWAEIRRLLPFLVAGIVLGVAFIAPFAFLGLKLGARIHTSLTQAQMRRVIGTLLVASGAILLARSLL